MKINHTLVLAAFLFGSSLSASAQLYRRAKRMAAYTIHADSILHSFKDQLSNYTFDVENDTSDLAFSPLMYRISEPSTYYSDALRDQFCIDWKSEYADADSLTESSEGMDYRTSLNKMIDQALVSAYTNNPDNFTHYDSQLDNVEILADTKIESDKKEVDEILQSAPVIQDVTKVIADTAKLDIKPEKPNFWKKSGKFTTQFTQNYFSNNWYKGGNNNVTLLSTLLLEANYNDQNKIQWDNKADLRLGFVSAPSDTCHNFLTSNDKIYLYSKLGIKATKSWYYTIQGEVNTQFMPGYKTNQKKTFSKFLAPLDVFVSIGMDFKPTLKKGTLSVALLPLSYKYRLIGSDDDEYTIHAAYNMKKLDDGTYRSYQHDFGSKIEANYKVELIKNLTWRSRFYYYTTYKYIESEWENAFSFQFNKYLSTEVNALWRFDDNRDPKYKDDKLGFFQFKEYFTFGLAYNF